MSALILLALIAMLVVGVMLVRLGLRGRRINRDPVCRDCGFNLASLRLPEMHGIAAPVVGGEMSATSTVVTCPECGAGLKRARALRIGERKRMLWVSIVGMLVIVGCVGAVAPIGLALLTGRGMHAKLPLGVLLYVATGGDGAIAGELETRLLGNSLDKEQVEAIAKKAVALQSDWSGEWSPKWGDVFEAAIGTGNLPQDLVTEWDQQSIRLGILPREVINPGDPLPLRIVVKEKRIHPSGRMNARVLFDSITVGGVQGTFISPLEGSAGETHISAAGGKSGMGGDGQGRALVRLPSTISLGTQPIEMKFRVVDYQNQAEQSPVLSAHAEVRVARADEPSVKAIPATLETREQVWTYLRPRKAQIALAGWAQTGDGPIIPTMWRYQDEWHAKDLPPVDLAMSIWIVDAEGTEKRLGEICTSVWGAGPQVNKGISVEGSVSKAPALSGKATIIFRPESAIAMRTPVVREYFGEEIRFDDVPIEFEAYLGSGTTVHSIDADEVVKAVNADKQK